MKNLKLKKISKWFQKILHMKKCKSTLQTCLNLKSFQFNKRLNNKFCQFYSDIWQIMNQKKKKTKKKINTTAKLSVHSQLFVTQRLSVSLIQSLSSNIYTSYLIWYVFMVLDQGSLVIERKLGKHWSSWLMRLELGFWVNYLMKWRHNLPEGSRNMSIYLLYIFCYKDYNKRVRLMVKAQ